MNEPPEWLGAIVPVPVLDFRGSAAHPVEFMTRLERDAEGPGRSRVGAACLWALAVALVAPSAQAAYPVFGANDVPTVFFISKSDDRNRVDYWMRLDAHCQPVNDDALTPYWREFEKAPPVVTHSIGLLDRMAYGIAAQRVASRTATSSDYAVRLKAVGRPIGITTHRDAKGKCVSVARTTIAGTTAELLSIHVKLSGPLSVDYIDIKGRDFRTGKPIT
ncbi:MAG TPA: DUF4833 domain-containing protein, partial [Polyangiaceae bacterium]|nr:DUF4833 domain-containing protein [Polyangiaceae bacterium]